MAVAGLTACSASGSSNDNNKSSVTIATSTSLTDSLDPQVENLYGPNQVDFNNVFEPLVRWAPGVTSDVEPVLALSWKLTTPTTTEFTLRKGVKFQDGEPFNAAAAAFSINRIIKPELKSIVAANVAGTIVGADVVDDDTVRITTNGPDPILLNRLTKIMMVPPAYLDNDPMSKKLDDAPIGTGPYKFTKRTAGGGVDIAAWNGYWGDKPSVKTVHLISREDDSARTAALKTGEADVIIDAPLTGVDSLPQVVEVPALEVTTIRLNGLGGPTADDKFRQAISMGIDHDTIQKTFFGKHAVAADGQIVRKGVSGYDPSVQDYKFDPKKAAALVKESTYDGSAIPLVYPGGGRFPRAKEVSEAIASQLGAIGINVKLDEEPFSTWLTEATTVGPKAPSMLYARPGTDGVRDGSEAFNIRVPSGAICNWSPVSYTKLAEPIYEKAEVETDITKRNDLMAQVGSIIHDATWEIPLFSNTYIWGAAKGVKWDVTQDDLIRLATLTVN